MQVGQVNLQSRQTIRAERTINEGQVCAINNSVAQVATHGWHRGPARPKPRQNLPAVVNVRLKADARPTEVARVKCRMHVLNTGTWKNS